ncbi:MAG: helix-hairpin-helix domain-containing protein [Chloroflexi bacterium]|nr:helix-hairpin-helix domain-containing protein [Chloroflexota bacterium]MBL7061731.1 helix-hairpin-helix domain-containing protein [Dehalococcoidia bacterium]
MSSHLNKYWLLIIAFLLVSLISGGIVLAVKQSRHKPVEISLSQTVSIQCEDEIYIGGTVVNPGFYPLREDDSIETLIQAAGLTPDADMGKIKIYVPKTGEVSQPQRINLNRAEAWLLDALPGIGPDRAQAIVNYRNQYGSFHRIEDLLNVSGIGSTTLGTIRDLVTLED